MTDLEKLVGTEVAVCWGADSIVGAATGEGSEQGVTALLVRGILELHPDGIMCRVVSDGGAAFFNVHDMDEVVPAADFGPFALLPVITIKDSLATVTAPQWLN
jgi:hypothetical protein